MSARAKSRAGTLSATHRRHSERPVRRSRAKRGVVGSEESVRSRYKNHSRQEFFSLKERDCHLDGIVNGLICRNRHDCRSKTKQIHPVLLPPRRDTRFLHERTRAFVIANRLRHERVELPCANVLRNLTVPAFPINAEYPFPDLDKLVFWKRLDLLFYRFDNTHDFYLSARRSMTVRVETNIAESWTDSRQDSGGLGWMDCTIITGAHLTPARATPPSTARVSPPARNAPASRGRRPPRRPCPRRGRPSCRRCRR